MLTNTLFTRILIAVWICCAILLFSSARADPALPIASGEYTFQHRDAEFPHSPGFTVQVIIKQDQITVINPEPYGPIPSGIIDEATIMWHAKTQQWILGYSDADRTAPEVGGCSDGPNTIDFTTRTIWTCMGGP